ncbi:MAG: glycosyltransferase family 39 protein [Polyangiaceae bacterium]
MSAILLDRRLQAPSSALWLLSLMGITLLLRFPVLLSYPLNPDEAYYAIGAVELNAGGTYFRDVVDHKLPGIYLIYSLVYRLAGRCDLSLVHLGLIVAVALTAYVLGLLAEEFFGSRVGKWAGILYAFSSVIGPATDYQAANAELFMNLPLVTALWLVARIWTNRRATCILLSWIGVLSAIAILIRPQAALSLAPLPLVFIQRRLPFLQWLFFGLGCLLPIAATVFWLFRGHAIHEAIACLNYGTYYVNALPLETMLSKGVVKTANFLLTQAGLVLPATLMMVRGSRADREWQSGIGAFLVCWLGASFLAVCLGGRFYPHYFIQLIPPLVVIAARQLTNWLPEKAPC